MTQTEKTEALKELREWFTKVPFLLDSDKSLLRNEFRRILEDTEATIPSPEDNITIKIYTALLEKGGSIHINGYELFKEDNDYHLINNFGGHAQVSAGLVALLETIKLL